MRDESMIHLCKVKLSLYYTFDFLKSTPGRFARHLDLYQHVFSSVHKHTFLPFDENLRKLSMTDL